MSSEIKFIIEKFSMESVRAIEEILKNYRAVCQSDVDFTKRMRVMQDIGQPQNITQYWFDSSPAFYSIFNIDGYKVSMKFKPGYWKSETNE